MRVGSDREIRSFARGIEIGIRSAPAAALAGRALVGSRPVLHAVVEVVVRGQSRLDRRGDPMLRQLEPERMVRDAKRTARAMKCVRAALLVLGLLEIGEHALPVPSGAAAALPIVVVRRVTAYVQHAVDRARAAQHLASRLKQRPALELGLGLGFVHPVVIRIGVQLRVSHRHLDPDAAILASGFQQQHAVPATFAEPRGDHATGRARAGHDVVVGIRVVVHALFHVARRISRS